MKIIVLMMLLVTNLAIADDWIIGTWKLDVESTKSTYSDAGLLDDDMKMMLEFFGQGSIEFKEGKIITIVEEGGLELPSSMEVMHSSASKITIKETTLIGKVRTRTFVLDASLIL